MKTLLTWILLIGLAWYLYTDKKQSDQRVAELEARTKQLQEDASREPEETPIPAQSAPIQASMGSLSLVRGKVKAVTNRGVFVSCEIQGTRNPAQFTLPASASNGDVAAMVQWAKRVEQDSFGPALHVENGRLVPGTEPQEKISGLILLTGHPQQASLYTGQNIKVAAMATGQITGQPYPTRIFTLNYQLPKGSWMLDGQYNSPLNRPSYRR